MFSYWNHVSDMPLTFFWFHLFLGQKRNLILPYYKMDKKGGKKKLDIHKLSSWPREKLTSGYFIFRLVNWIIAYLV